MNKFDSFDDLQKKAEILSAARSIIEKKPAIYVYDFLGTIFRNQFEIDEIQTVYEFHARDALMFAITGGRAKNKSFLNSRSDSIRDIDLAIIHNNVGHPSFYLDFVRLDRNIKIDALFLPPEATLGLPHTNRILTFPDPVRYKQIFNDAIRLIL